MMNNFGNIQVGTMECSLGNTIKEFEEFFYSIKKDKLYRFIMETVEKPVIEGALERVDGNQLKAARMLGINRNTLHSKIKKLGIEVRRWKRL